MTELENVTIEDILKLEKENYSKANLKFIKCTLLNN